MKRRCYKSYSGNYYRYGGRGIRVCDDWKDDFNNFRYWCVFNGWRKGLQLDRIDNESNYCPENCRFVTPAENSRNCRSSVIYEFNGKKQCLTDWANDLGMSAKGLKERIQNWGIEKALTTRKLESWERIKTLDRMIS